MEKIKLIDFIENFELNESKKTIKFSNKLDKLIKKMEKIVHKKDENFKEELKKAKKLQKDFILFENRIKNNKLNKKQIKIQGKKLILKTKKFLKNNKSFSKIKIVKFFLFSLIVFISYNIGFHYGQGYGIFVSEEFPELSDLFKKIVESYKIENNIVDRSKLLIELQGKLFNSMTKSFNTINDKFSGMFTKLS